MSLDDCCGPPVLACRDLPDPSPCRHAVCLWLRGDPQSFPAGVCGTAGSWFIGSADVCGHGMISGTCRRDSPHLCGLMSFIVRGFLAVKHNRSGRIRGALRGKRSGAPSVLAFIAQVFGTECCPSPILWDWTHSDQESDASALIFVKYAGCILCTRWFKDPCL